MAARIQKELDQMLIEAGKITPQQLEDAIAEQRKTGEKLTKTIVKMGLLKEKEIVQSLGQHLGIQVIDLSKYQIDKELVRLIPQDVAMKYQLVPVFKDLNVLTIAMVDPSNAYAVDEVTRLTQHELELAVCTEADMTQAL